MKTMSLKVQITVLVVLLVATLVGAFSWIAVATEKRMMFSEVLQRVVLQGRNLALSSAKPLLHEDPEFVLHPLISRVLDAERDIVSIVVTDRAGIIKGHRDVIRIDRPYAPMTGLREIADTPFAGPGETIRQNDRLFEVAVPVTDQEALIGYVYLQYSKAGIHDAISAIRLRMIRIGLVALAIGACLSILLALHIARPVRILTKGAEAIGEGRFDTRIDVRAAVEIQTLARTFNDMTRRLEENRRALVQQERIERELEIAREIQATLLPARLPSFDRYEIDACYHPASQVGGDYFDLIPVDEHRLMLVIGDVAGKGVPGLVVMAMVRILVRALAGGRMEPHDLLRHLNELLRKDMKRNFFVTLFCGLLDTRDGRLQFASAGHMPLIVYSGAKRSATAVATGAKPLGIFSNEIFSRGLEEQRITMAPGDVVLQFTDGLSETRNAAGEEYGMDRLMAATAVEAGGGAKHLVGTLLANLAAFRGEEPQGDDLTIVAVAAASACAGRAAPAGSVRPERAPSG